jgi:hypothetical protein
MKSFRSELKSLTAVVQRFDPDHLRLKSNSLQHLTKMALPISVDLVVYYEALLFLCAYPSHPKDLVAIEKEFRRIARKLRSDQEKASTLFEGTGLPFMPTITKFSHDCLRWLLEHPDLDVNLHSLESSSSVTLNEVLSTTLPSLERSETTAGLNAYELMEALQIPEKKRLRFLVDQLSRLDDSPLVKDLLLDHLELFVRITPKKIAFSKAYNRLPVNEVFVHREILKQFSPREILDSPISTYTHLEEDERAKAIQVVRNAMALTARETDPTTYLKEESFQLYLLERGITVAIYEMIPERQLPLETYIGYTAFKNGYPTAYGGAWVFGYRAQFGINIFESFRGGESSFILTQLLRLYRQVFSIQYFEIEPYQFGLDNPEGIKSGAFWFYYKIGFRPIDQHLNALAKREWEKLNAKKGNRTSHTVLEKLTGSNIELVLANTPSPRVADIASQVTRLIHRKYNDNRLLAERKSVENFLKKVGAPTEFSKHEKKFLKDISLWAESMQVQDPASLELMNEMVRYKSVDMHQYQNILRKFF